MTEALDDPRGGTRAAFRFCPLASGSSGNCAFVRYGGTAVLVDAGISPRALRTRLAEIGESPEAVAGVFLTHEHSDHGRYAFAIAKALKVPLYATKGTFAGLGGLPPDAVACVPIARAGAVAVGALTVWPHATSHDGAETVAYSFEGAGPSAAIISDLGVVTERIVEVMENAEVAMFEANHDLGMLWSGRYPDRLKRRIASAVGHLSNAQARDAFLGLKRHRLQQVMLSHLSDHNNSPERVWESFESVLAALPEVRFHLAPQRRRGVALAWSKAAGWACLEGAGREGSAIDTL